MDPSQDAGVLVFLCVRCIWSSRDAPAALSGITDMFKTNS
jgi:hypothetical protein